MKKFSRLLAVVLAIAVVICPMMSAVAFADGGNSVTLESVANNKLVLTINSANGFMVTKATVAFTGDVCNFNVEDYTLVEGTKDGYNLPFVSLNKGDGEVTFIVSSTDAATLDLYSQVKIGITVDEGATVTLNNLQAASDKDEDGEPSDGDLISFEGISEDGTLEEPIIVPAVDPTPAGPVLDADIIINPAFYVNDCVGTTYLVDVASISKYDDYYLEISRNTCDADYNFVPISDRIYRNDGYVDVEGQDYIIYTGIGMYELGIEVNAQLFAIKGGEVVAYSNKITSSVADIAKAGYAITGSDEYKNLVTDMLNMGAEAQNYFTDDRTNGSDLAELEYVNKDFDQTFASKDLPTFNPVNTNTGSISITPVLSLGASPALCFITPTDNGCQDVKYEASYYNAYLDQTITSGKMLPGDANVIDADGDYYVMFPSIALYDSNKTVTFKIYDGDNVVATNTYSVDTFASEYIDDQYLGNVLKAVAKFGAAARSYFETA